MPRRKAEQGEEATPIPDGMVAVRVTKHGAGKLSTGDHVVGGDVMAERDDILIVDPETAQNIESKGYAEIE